LKVRPAPFVPEPRIHRTAPEYGHAPALHEAATLTDDALAMARRTIYLEAQYLTDPRVGALLLRHLANPAGPEIVIVMAGNSHGLAPMHSGSRK